MSFLCALRSNTWAPACWLFHACDTQLWMNGFRWHTVLWIFTEIMCSFACDILPVTHLLACNYVVVRMQVKTISILINTDTSCLPRSYSEQWETHFFLMNWKTCLRDTCTLMQCLMSHWRRSLMFGYVQYFLLTPEILTIAVPFTPMERAVPSITLNDVALFISKLATSKFSCGFS